MPADDAREPNARTAGEAHLALVDEHVRAENRHDLAGIMDTFGEAPTYDDEPWAERHAGGDGVGAYYEALLRAVPDMHIDVQRRHVTDDHVILEVVFSGTHSGPWRGLQATGRHVEFPLGAVYSFDEDDRLAGERIYYDRATVLRRLGVFYESDSGLGRLLVLLTHPLTVGRAILHSLRREGRRTA